MGKLPQERPVQTSPRTPTSSNSSTSSNNSTCHAGGGGSGGAGAGSAPATAPPTTPSSLSRSDANPYPTTFVQADASSFKKVVQMLTGSAETAARHHHQTTVAATEAPSSRGLIPPAKTGPKRPAFKLYERRHHSFKNLKAIGMPADGGASPGCFSLQKLQQEILSPSVLDFPSLTLGSPITPLSVLDPFNRPPHDPNSSAGLQAEERAIADKGFYLHPSPRTTPRDADPPRLLPLFPVTSPRVSYGIDPTS